MRRKYLGRILGVLGLVLLLSSVLTFLIGAPEMALGKVVIALALFGFYIATNLGELGSTASSRGTFFLVVSAVSTVVVLGALVFANYIAVKNPKTWDLTANQIHTLSPDTVKTLEGLKQDVNVFAFFAGGDPALAQAKDLFSKYEARSQHLKVEIIDPIKDPMRVAVMNIKESGPRVVVKLGNTESRVQDLSEEGLTNALVKVTHASEKKVYFVTGHGEADFQDESPAGFSELKKRMENEGLKAEKLNLASAESVPADAQTVVVAGPTKAFQPGEIELLEKYLDAGGKALLMVEPKTEHGLDGLLKKYAVEADDTVVFDPLSRLMGASPLIPVVANYNEQAEITRGFTLNTAFPTARPLTILHDVQGPSAQPLALTMPSAWGETDPNGRPQRDEFEKGGPFPVVVTVTKDTAAAEAKRSDQLRLVVAGDRDFATNKYRNHFGNEDFVLNCLNWLSDQTERITIRPRTRAASRLYLTDSQQSTIFFLAIDVLPVSLLAIGLTVWLVRRSK